MRIELLIYKTMKLFANIIDRMVTNMMKSKYKLKKREREKVVKALVSIDHIHTAQCGIVHILPQMNI